MAAAIAAAITAAISGSFASSLAAESAVLFLPAGTAADLVAAGCSAFFEEAAPAC